MNGASTTMVVDLSHWNTVRSWDEMAKVGIVGVMHKYSEGGTYVDPTYQERFAAASAAGLRFGRYHFANSGDVTAQVRNFLQGWTPVEALALDWEDNQGNKMTLAGAQEFIAQVYQQTGVVPILYSGNTLKEALGGKPNPAFKDVRLWLAQYAANPTLPPGWTDYWLWQYSDKGTVAGVNGPCDVNRFQGTAADLYAGWVTPKAPRPVPDPAPETETVTVQMVVPKGTGVTIQVTGPASVVGPS